MPVLCLFACFTLAAAPPPKWRIRVPTNKPQRTAGIQITASLGASLVGPGTNVTATADYTILGAGLNPAGYSVGWFVYTPLTTAGATATVDTPNARITDFSSFSTNGSYTLGFGVTNNTTGARNWVYITPPLVVVGTPFTPPPPVIPPVSTNNLPPLISILTPGNGQSFTGLASTVIFTADAQDRQGPVTIVGWDIQNLSSGATVHGESSGAPWAFTNDFAPGTYKATATAQNLAGLTTPTNLTFQIVLPAIVPPVVYLSEPTNNLTLTAPGAHGLTAVATDGDGTIQSVQFYRDGTLIGSDVTSPYTLAVSGLAVGSYSYSAAATDNGGNRAVSSNVVVVVNAAIVPVAANAGPDQSIPSGATAQLGGAATGSGISSTTWTQNTGPGTAVFSSTVILNPTVTFSAVAAGQPSATYALRLTVVGTSGTTFDDVVITVSPPPAVDSLNAKGFPTPVVVAFPNRTVESQQFVLTNNFNPSLVLTQWLTVHGLNHDGKMGIQLNNGPVEAVKNATVSVQGNGGSIWGGIGGAFHTLTFAKPIPASTLTIGTNTVAFWWFDTNAFNAFFQHQPYSYQVLTWNIKDGSGNWLIPTNTFPDDNPENWTPPLPNVSDAAAGLVLFTNRNTLKTITGAAMIASCADCHFRDGGDLQYFSYHNKAIIARAKTHGLTQNQGEQIASMVRRNSRPRYGRPWNPPYQPGPGLDAGPVGKWLAGAGIGWVLPDDDDKLPYIFPGSVITNTVIEISDRLSARDTPTDIQLPDWNHWLPQVHPLDAFGTNNVGRTKLLAWYDGGTGFVPGADDGYVMRRQLIKGNAQSVRNVGAGGWQAWDQQGFSQPSLRSMMGWADYSTVESQNQAIYGIQLFHLVKTAEIMTEYELEELVPQTLLKSPLTTPDARAWRGSLFFDASPNILHLNNSHHAIANNTPLMWYYFSMAWYRTQLLINNGSRTYTGLDYVHSQRPNDVSYLAGFLADWPTYTGIGNAYEVMVYLTVLGQGIDTGRGPERWQVGGWNNATAYRIVDLFAHKQASFANVSTATRRLLVEAILRNWIAKSASFPAANYGLNLDAVGNVPAIAPNRNWTGPSDPNLDYTALPVWNMFGASNSMQSYGIDKSLQNSIIDWAKLVWPAANWESRRPPP